VSRIDELPLDLFGEDGQPSRVEPEAPVEAAAPVGTGTNGIDAESLTGTASRKLYDVLAVSALILGSAIVLRAMFLGVTLPVANSIIAFILYRNIPVRYKHMYYRQVDNWRQGVRRDIAMLDDMPVQRAESDSRIFYDVGIVVVLAVAARLVLELAGFGFLLPGRYGWWIVLMLVTGVYALFARSHRHDLHAWIDWRLRHLSDARVGSGRD
jgi:hypothetical protein